MRALARFGLGLCGLALVAPPMLKAEDAPSGTAGPADAMVMKAPAHNHKGVFGSRYCVECQRAKAKKRDGVDVPPPPTALPAGAIPGQVAHNHPEPTRCAACEAGAVVMGPVTIVDSYPAGRAVVGGPVMADANAPGRAVVGGMESAVMASAGAGPAPVGVSRAGVQARWTGPKVAAAGTRPGSGSSPYDPAVMPSSMIPAQTAVGNASSGHPHVIRHLLGIGDVSRHIRQEREDHQRSAHASISYDPAAQPVNSLPSSMVYGKGH